MAIENIKEVVASLNRFNLNACDQTRKAFHIANDLSAWCDSFRGSPMPAVEIAVTFGGVSINVGPFTVFCSDTDSCDDLTLESCIQRFKQEANAMQAWEPEID